MDQTKYKEALKSLSFRLVSFGYMTVHIYEPEQIGEAQIGYSVSSAGSPLIGKDEGNWKENWLVIGHEDMCGDPIFIDASEEGFPVYTAMHGTGSWDANMIADNLHGFDKALQIISTISGGRKNPAELDANPLPASERNRVIAEIQMSNPKSDMSFWEGWLG